MPENEPVEDEDEDTCPDCGGVRHPGRKRNDPYVGVETR